MINGGNEVPEGYQRSSRRAMRWKRAKLAEFYRQAGADFLKTYSELTPGRLPVPGR
jgi:hypothetical protein